jgi:hypothetical protein
VQESGVGDSAQLPRGSSSSRQQDKGTQSHEQETSESYSDPHLPSPSTVKALWIAEASSSAIYHHWHMSPHGASNCGRHFLTDSSFQQCKITLAHTKTGLRRTCIWDERTAIIERAHCVPREFNAEPDAFSKTVEWWELCPSWKP